LTANRQRDKRAIRPLVTPKYLIASLQVYFPHFPPDSAILTYSLALNSFLCCMKKMFLLFILISVTFYSFSQTDSAKKSSSYTQQENVTLPPYKRFPTVPPLKLLLLDSTSYFTKNDLKKNKPVLIIVFNPDCEHCKHETEELIKNIDSLKNVQIIMATMMPFDLMRSFYENYDLQRFQNITVGKDVQYTLPSFYQMHFMPYLAMYDKKGNLLSTFEGAMKIEDLIHTFK
jgi:thiol-disulfide isomerase/thioredoxin